MAVTVAVFLFAAQILGAGATVEGLASVNFASERVLAEVAQLSRHVLWVSQAAQATLRANVGKESRRLATADKYCEWKAAGNASAKCMQNDAWASAKLSTFSDPMMKSMATRSIKCATFLTLTACQEGSCRWDGGACDITMTENEEQAVMALFIPATGCGWIGTMMQSMGKCSSAGACNAADKCEKKTEKAPSDDGKSCVSKSTCEPNDAAAGEALCPGVKMETVSKECEAEAKAASTTDMTVMMQAMMACFSRKCPFYGTMMNAVMGPTNTCKALTKKTECSSNSQCKWVVEGGNVTKCDADEGVIMASLVPAGCPMKGVMHLQSKCPEDAAKATCEKESACLWAKEKECSTGGVLTTKEQCEPTPTAITTAMATTTANKDVKLFAGLAQQQAQCFAIKTQEACTGSADKKVKGKEAPVFPTIVSDVASGTQLIAASGFLLWSLFASLVGPLA